MADQPCVIAEQVTIRGSVTGSEDLVVAGRIEGNIALSNHLTVEEGGVVEADIDVEALTVNGTVVGDMRSSQGVTLGIGAQVAGTINAPKVSIEDGARFKGRIEMDVDLPADVNRPG